MYLHFILIFSYSNIILNFYGKNISKLLNKIHLSYGKTNIFSIVFLTKYCVCFISILKNMNIVYVVFNIDF